MPAAKHLPASLGGSGGGTFLSGKECGSAKALNTSRVSPVEAWRETEVALPSESWAPSPRMGSSEGSVKTFSYVLMSLGSGHLMWLAFHGKDSTGSFIHLFIQQNLTSNFRGTG